MFKIFPFLVLIGLLAGCAATGPSTSLYLLDQNATRPPAPTLADNAPNVALARVSVAGFLDKSGIVYQTGPNKVSVAASNLWAEPLPEQLHSAVFAELARKLKGMTLFPGLQSAPARSLRLSLKFSGFHGRYDGKALVAGLWTLSDAQGQALIRQPFEYKVALQSDGYDQLVRALSIGLEATTRDIAATLNHYTQPKHAPLSK